MNKEILAVGRQRTDCQGQLELHSETMSLKQNKLIKKIESQGNSRASNFQFLVAL